MEKLIEGLTKGPFWLLVVLFLVYLLVTNFDKVSPILTRPNAVEKATRDVPSLLDRQKQAEEMGQHHLSRYIGVHLSGVVAPKLRRILDKEVSREIKKSQPAHIKHRLLFIFGVYSVSLIVFFLAFMYMYVLFTERAEFGRSHDFLTFLIFTIIFIVGMWVIQRVYTVIIRKAGSKVDADYNKRFDEWMTKYDLVPSSVRLKDEDGILIGRQKSPAP